MSSRRSAKWNKTHLAKSVLKFLNDDGYGSAKNSEDLKEIQPILFDNNSHQNFNDASNDENELFYADEEVNNFKNDLNDIENFNADDIEEQNSVDEDLQGLNISEIIFGIVKNLQTNENIPKDFHLPFSSNPGYDKALTKGTTIIH
jgi:hypothetical protein